VQQGTVSSADRLSQGVIAWRRASWPQMREIPSKNKCKKSTKKEKKTRKNRRLRRATFVDVG